MTFAFLIVIFLSASVFVWTALDQRFIEICRRQAERLTEARRRRKSLRAMENQWPAALYLLSGSLKSGLTLEQAFGAMSRQAPEPLRSFFNQLLPSGAAWIPLSTRIALAFSAPELSTLRAIFLMSHVGGGKAAPIVESAARVLRRRLEMKEKVAVLTAQGRASAWIVGLSPFCLLAFIYLFSPDFLKPLWTTHAGRLALSSSLLLNSVGLWLVNRLAKIDL